MFADRGTSLGHGLGRDSMPEMAEYSAVTAVHTLWLAARAEGLGMGWISILDPAAVTKALDVPASWTLVAYLCIGWPAEEHLDPELDRYRWQQRLDMSRMIFKR